MELKRDLIAEIKRAPGGGVPAGEDAAPILNALTRFPDRDEWYFLYQAGKRVGWRLVETRREIRRGVAGYVRRDRMVFTAPGGGPAEVDLHLTEFVDAELRPVETQQRLAAIAGVSTPTLSRFEGGDKNIELASALAILGALGLVEQSSDRAVKGGE